MDFILMTDDNEEYGRIFLVDRMTDEELLATCKSFIEEAIEAEKEEEAEHD